MFLLLSIREASVVGLSVPLTVTQSHILMFGKDLLAKLDFKTWSDLLMKDTHPAHMSYVRLKALEADKVLQQATQDQLLFDALTALSKVEVGLGPLNEMFNNAVTHTAEFTVAVAEDMNSLGVPTSEAMNNELKDWTEEKMAEYRQKVRGCGK